MKAHKVFQVLDLVQRVISAQLSNIQVFHVRHDTIVQGEETRFH